jgi:diguanylate cyclase (GGDEF)-like protein
MESIQAVILECRKTSACDDIFIKRLKDLAEIHGDSIFPAIFNTLTTLDLPRVTAREFWFKVLDHRKYLRQKLDREIDLLTTISDFLHTCTDYLQYSRLVDSGTFERVLSGTTHDNLTGLFNRPYFDDTYEQQVSLAKRYNTDLSILFLDIDDFKDVNDSMGHITGDNALVQVAHIIQTEKRESDIAARYGGEEFVLLMPHTPNINAFILAERIRKVIEKTEIHFQDHTFKLTISGGLASYPLNSIDPKDLLFMADSALYLAKGAGKNTISQFKKDQRRYLRVKLQLPILVKELGFKEERVYSCTIKDIGMGGILFENEQPLPLGTMLQISLLIDDDAPLLLIGKVVRIEALVQENYEIGISFTFKELAKNANSKIANFLKDIYYN